MRHSRSAVGSVSGQGRRRHVCIAYPPVEAVKSRANERDCSATAPFEVKQFGTLPCSETTECGTRPDGGCKRVLQIRTN